MTDGRDRNLSPEQAGRLDDLLRQAMEQPASERSTFVDRQCRDDECVRSEAHSLLARLGDDAGTAELPGAGSLTAAFDDHAPFRPRRDVPDRIGPYEIIRELGHGGMGIVYLAVRHGEGDFQRHVAIKVLKRGMDSEEILQRFDTERRVLATLNHAAIARLYEAGETDEGQPYFVMENVVGLPIDDFCDLHRLRIDERLALFQSVCSAVHHAHQNLVVHRDLKPSNIMVTEDGQVKLLDFGIAKLINPDLAHVAAPTSPQHRVMTPRYASPEQVRGNPISTASDVYSLGVLLYELLCGHPPYRIEGTSAAEIERIVCEAEPERPSTAIGRTEELPDSSGSTTTVTPEVVSRSREVRPERLRRRLAGDLDNIVLKAMRKEPNRRYASAQDLADDLQRHLDGMPVNARSDTLTYRAGKFVKRHRVGVGAAAGIAVVLVAGIVGTTRGLEREKTLRTQVEAERDRVTALWDQGRLAAQALFGIHDEIKGLEATVTARELLADTAVDYLEGVRAHVGDDVDLLAELAEGYEKSGDMYTIIRGSSLGGVAKAIPRYETSLELRRRVAALLPGDPDAERGVGLGLQNIGDVKRRTGDALGALVHYRERLEIAERLSQAHPENEQYQRDVGIALADLGVAHVLAGQPTEAMLAYERSYEVRKTLYDADPANRRFQRDLFVIHKRLGGRHEALGAYDEAVRHYRDARRIATALVAADPDDTRRQRDLMGCDLSLSTALRRSGEVDAALRRAEAALDAASRRREANPEDASAASDEAWTYEALGDVHAVRGEWEAALEASRADLTILADLAERDPDDIQVQQRLATAYERVARATLEVRTSGAGMIRGEPGLGEIDLAIGTLRRLIATDAADARMQRDLASSLTTRGYLLVRLGRARSALPSLDEARSITAELRLSQPTDVYVRNALARATVRTAEAHAVIRNADAAAQILRDDLTLSEITEPEILGVVADVFDRVADDTAAADARCYLGEILNDRTDPAAMRLRPGSNHD